MTLHENCYVSLCFMFITLISRLQAQNPELFDKINTASIAASQTFSAFVFMFNECIKSRMPHMQFLIDDVQSFVNYPSKTTVGLATKFTGNRKFFANMITTTAFKEMLSNDSGEIWNNLIKKMKYCDEVVMDQELLKEFYDREVDQSKL